MDDLDVVGIRHLIIDNVAALKSISPNSKAVYKDGIHIVTHGTDNDGYIAGVLCDSHRFIQGKSETTIKEAIQSLLRATMEAVSGNRARMFFGNDEKGVSVDLFFSGGKMRNPVTRQQLEDMIVKMMCDGIGVVIGIRAAVSS